MRSSRLRWRRLVWLIAIWAASVATLAIVAYGLRLLMRAGGLSA